MSSLAFLWVFPGAVLRLLLVIKKIGGLLINPGGAQRTGRKPSWLLLCLCVNLPAVRLEMTVEFGWRCWHERLDKAQMGSRVPEDSQWQ